MHHTAHPSGNQKEFGNGERTSRSQHRQHHAVENLVGLRRARRGGMRQCHRQGARSAAGSRRAIWVDLPYQEVVAALEADGVEKFIARRTNWSTPELSARRCPLNVDLADSLSWKATSSSPTAALDAPIKRRAGKSSPYLARQSKKRKRLDRSKQPPGIAVERVTEIQLA
jgi:hypothetical protein